MDERGGGCVWLYRERGRVRVQVGGVRQETVELREVLRDMREAAQEAKTKTS